MDVNRCALVKVKSIWKRCLSFSPVSEILTVFIIVSKTLRRTAVNHISNKKLSSIYLTRHFPEHFEVMCVASRTALLNQHIPAVLIHYLTPSVGRVVSPGLSLKYRGIHKLWILIDAWTVQVVTVYFRVERGHLKLCWLRKPIWMG